DLRRADQGALLAVEKLRIQPGGHVVANLTMTLLAHPIPHRGAEDGDVIIRRIVGRPRIDVDGPVQPGVRVPLLLFALLVQAGEAAPNRVVAAVDARRPAGAHVPRGVVDGRGVPTDALVVPFPGVRGRRPRSPAPPVSASAAMRARGRATSAGSRPVG